MGERGGVGSISGTSIKYRNEPSKSTSNGSDQILSLAGPKTKRETRRIRKAARREREREQKRKRESKPGQTGPRLAEVAPGLQTINKERSNLWTGSLISTLLLFSHLIDGLPRRFVLPRLPPFPPTLRVQQLHPPPPYISPFVSLFPS